MKSLTLTAACLMTLSALAPLSEAQDTPDYTQLHELNDRLGQAQAYRYRLFDAVPVSLKHDRVHEGAYSDTCQQPFGIYAAEGTELELTIDHAPEHVALEIFDPETLQSKRFELKSGVNQITTPQAGLCYFYYPRLSAKPAKPIRAYLKGGKINGIYNHGEGARVWAFIQKMPSSEYMEMLGDHLHLILPKSLLSDMDAEEGERILERYESIHASGRRLLGEGSYSASTPQRICLFPSRPADNAPQLAQASPDLLLLPISEENHRYLAKLFASRISSLIPSHQGELSAALQYMVTELSFVTNANTLRSSSTLHDKEMLFIYNQKTMVNRALWNASMKESDEESLYQAAAPLCSLYIYFTLIRGDKNFLPRLMERLQLLQKQNLSPSTWRQAFLMALCDASKRDLTHFFLTTRMLAPMNRPLNGSTDAPCITMTMDDIKKVWQHASKYPQDECRAIHLVQPHTAHMVQDKTALDRTFTLQKNDVEETLIIPERGTAGVIAYEAYNAESQLIGLFIPSEKVLEFRLPLTTQYVRGVAWNGTNTVVYSKK